MLVEFLGSLFFIFNILLIILIVMQKNHGGFWSGPAGGDSVNIFGGNQGADVLQKITWVFGIILMGGSLFFSVYQASQSQISQFYSQEIQEVIAKKDNEKKTLDETTQIDNENNSEKENLTVSKIPLQLEDANQTNTNKETKEETKKIVSEKNKIIPKENIEKKKNKENNKKIK